jgi:hypothetical protein
VNLPDDDVRRALLAMSDEGIVRAAAHCSVRSRSRLARIEGIVRSRMFLGCTWNMTDTDLRAVAAALGVEQHASSSLSELRALVLERDAWWSPGELRRRARLAEIGPTGMTVEVLLDAGQRLTKPVTRLVKRTPDSTAATIACWVGAGGAERSLPWLRVDLRAHPDPACRRDAVLEVHADAGEGHGHAVVVPALLEPRRGETALCGITSEEIPSLAVLFLEGDDAIASWLVKNRWKREWEYTGNFPDRDCARGYAAEWRRSHSISDAETWAQLGGWPLSWGHENAGAQLAAGSLLLRTYKDAEPWIEVSLRGGEPRVAVRIT